MNGTSDNTIWKWFLGNRPTTLALPDYYANYFAYSFEWKRHQEIGLKIRGQFGYARYMSYNLYNEATGKSLGSLMDVDINPQPGSVNPFRAGTSPDAPNREYVVTVFFDDSEASQLDQNPQNPLTFNTDDNVGTLVVMLRYYVPEGTNCSVDNMAQVPLPTIEAFDVNTNLPVPLPPNLVASNMPEQIYGPRMAAIFATIIDDTLRFYNVGGGGEFNNNDNLYLITAVEKAQDEVLLLKFQAPIYATYNSGFPDAEVRYWSFNQDNSTSSTATGMTDEAFNVAKDGLIYIAIGDPAIQQRAHQGGYNFMEWKATTQQAVVLYRNLVTNDTFAGSIANVPDFNIKEHPIEGPDDPRIKAYDAVNFIHAYAPTGKKVKQAQFLENYGGMPSPGFKVAGS